MPNRLHCLAILASFALSSTARADDNPGMALMKSQMQCPAIAADGKHVAIYSLGPGAEKESRTHLVVFDAAGAAGQQIGVVPPAIDVTRAKTAADAIAKLLADGGYKRMSRVAQVSEKTVLHDSAKAPPPSFTAQFSSEDLVLDVKIADRKLELQPTRAGKKLAAIARTLPAKDGPCKSLVSYSIGNTTSGFDAKTGLFAFSVQIEEDGGNVCFSHDYVVAVK